MSILTEVDDATLLAGMLFAAEAWIAGQDPRSHDEWTEVMREHLLDWQQERMNEPEEDDERDPGSER